MGINLALSRIVKLLSVLGNPQTSYKSIHIAGTNGKGSTVAYLSSILTKAHVRNGRFTSPHLLYYNDCISIDNETYPISKFKQVSDIVKAENVNNKIGCTEFEVLTVTAFKIFELEKVEYAIIEVGLGGRLDATNVLEPPSDNRSGGVILCGITKIGIDHESFLGSTFSQIASEKAGIIKHGIPCVVDKTNNDEVLEVIKHKTQESKSEMYLVDGNTPSIGPNNLLTPEYAQDLRRFSPLKGNYQLQNLSVALQLIHILKASYIPDISDTAIEQGIKSVVWPGRLQMVHLPNKNLDLLIDGAHNESAAQELKTFLDTYRDDHGIIFIIALSKGKSIENLMKYVANKDSDSIIASKFSPPQNMPWVKSYDVEPIQMAAKTYFNTIIESTNEDTIEDILTKVYDLKKNGDPRKVVVCGSLYLCSDILRYVNDS